MIGHFSACKVWGGYYNTGQNRTGYLGSCPVLCIKFYLDLGMPKPRLLRSIVGYSMDVRWKLLDNIRMECSIVGFSSGPV